MKKQPRQKQAYTGNTPHLADELKKLDLLILRRVTAIREQAAGTEELTTDPKLFISHQEVEHLLTQDAGLDGPPPGWTEIGGQLDALQEHIEEMLSATLKEGVFLALPQLAHLFNLSPFEMQVLLICLAPELRRKYDKLYAYLQDDIARKRPSISLVSDLLCTDEEEKWNARAYFSPHAPLFRNKLLEEADDPYSPSGSSGLARFLKVTPRLLDFILGHNAVDHSLAGVSELRIPDRRKEDVFIDRKIIKDVIDTAVTGLTGDTARGSRMVFYFHGPRGVGKQDLAAILCRELNCLLLYLDMEMLAAPGADTKNLLKTAFREGLMQQAVLYIDHMDCLLSPGTTDPSSHALLKTAAYFIREYTGLIVLAGERPWHPDGLFYPAVFHGIELNIPSVQLRREAWEKNMAQEMDKVEPGWTAELAGQFRLTPGQIRDTIQLVRSSIRAKGKSLTLSELFQAARRQSNRKLVELAAKITPGHGWDDLVLSEEKIELLKEICSQVRFRYQVFSKWGFKEKITHGRGLGILFSGSPGTGKTLAAEVMAHELQLDLYKIDLSSIVSKYIGETEKNLSKIFKEAETSNAILFFDEADALFGKRTEVSDAHDRYANIETSYLLQKMEEYEGIVILATNLRKNMDDAFTRRLRFVVEFPFPDEESRYRIWRTHIPSRAPVSTDIDFRFLAQRFPVAGGSIRNILLNAAFLAARNGRTIHMQHILNGAQREFEKIGKLWKEIKPEDYNNTGV
jgi:AAA+ superfamily predicted ATPase